METLEERGAVSVVVVVVVVVGGGLLGLPWGADGAQEGSVFVQVAVDSG
jgi:hypothetical protein